jgi:hypothetical protein
MKLRFRRLFRHLDLLGRLHPLEWFEDWFRKNRIGRWLEKLRVGLELILICLHRRWRYCGGCWKQQGP